MFKKLKLKASSKIVKKKSKKSLNTAPKRCRFCMDAELKKSIDYKNASLLKSFLTDCGNILSARTSGNCHSCQKMLTQSIKVSRIMALIEFCVHG